MLSSVCSEQAGDCLKQQQQDWRLPQEQQLELDSKMHQTLRTHMFSVYEQEELERQRAFAEAQRIVSGNLATKVKVEEDYECDLELEPRVDIKPKSPAPLLSVKSEPQSEMDHQAATESMPEVLCERNRSFANDVQNHAMSCASPCSQAASEVDEEWVPENSQEEHPAPDSEKEYECSKCGRMFSTKSHQLKHTATHESKKFTCPVCLLSFRQEISLEIHMSKLHSLALDGRKIQKKFECKSCRRRFGIVKELKRHYTYCEARQRIAAERRKLREKIIAALLHSTSSSCPVKPGIKENAIVTIRPVKDKSCPFCHHVFSTMQSRWRHILAKHKRKKNDPIVREKYLPVSSAAFPFSCNICLKSFASHASMTLHHRRIHENMKIHECSTCGKRYPLPSELRKHIKRVHETPKKKGGGNGTRIAETKAERLEMPKPSMNTDEAKYPVAHGDVREHQVMNQNVGLREVKSEIEALARNAVTQQGTPVKTRKKRTKKEELVEVYCFCRQESFGRMILCDDPQCEIGWYHFECIGMITAPRGKWYCDQCKEE